MPYLFNRSARLAVGNTLESMAWAAEITQKVNSVVDVHFDLWTRVLGPGIGTLAWSTVIGDLTEIVGVEEKLLADSSYIELVERGVAFNDGSGFDDTLGRFVHADPDGLGTAEYASITTTLLAPGMAAKGIALGVEMAQRIKSITGRPTSFGTSVTGPMGEVAFFILSDTIEQVQAVSEGLAADAEWVQMVDEQASKTFVAGASVRLLTRTIA
jgi:hypothetical protein